MLIVDEVTKKRLEHGRALERTREIASTSATGETRAAPLAGKVTDPERQKGHGLTGTEFMRRLRKVNSNIVMEPHPNRELPLHADKACLYLLMPDGTKAFLMAVENSFMPEWSLMEMKTVRVGRVESFWREQKIPGRELKRGWRTVLLRLLHMKLVTITDVEREFGLSTRESWNVLAGKRTGRLLI